MDRLKRTTSILAIALLLIMTAPWTSAEGVADEGVDVLFDFGDGAWHWAHVEVPDPANGWCATLHAAGELGLPLNYSFSQFGVFLSGVGDVETPEDFNRYWGLYVWDAGKGDWKSSTVGALDVTLEDGAAIAWKFAAFGDPAPDANPLTEEPFLSFRGGRRVAGAVGTSGPDAGGIFWSRDLGNGAIDSTPVVADGKVFGISGGVFDWNLFEFVQEPEVFALDATSGETLWSLAFQGSGGFEIGTVAYHDDVVFASLSNRNVVALDADEGTLLWSTEVDLEGLSSSPTVASGKVVTGTGGGKVVALDTGDGSVAWTVNVTGGVYLAAPTVHEGVVYIGTENGTLHALYLENGTQLWSLDIGGRLRGTPLVVEDRIYVISSDYSGFVPVDGRLHALTIDGVEVWRATLGPTGSSPTLLGGLILVGADSGLHAFNGEGSVAWSYQEAGKVSASPVATPDAVYIMSNVNDTAAGLHTSVISLGPDGNVLWAKVLVPHNWALSSVAIADGRAYAFTDAGWAYCLGDTPLGAAFEVTVDGLDVTFNDTTEGTASTMVAWEWDIPGQAPASGQNTSVRFTESGHYNVTLTVTDEFGRHAVITREVFVEKPTKDLDGVDSPGPGPVSAALAVAVAALLIAASRRRGG